MSTLSRLLEQPEYIHAAINHFPLIGVFIAILALIASLIARSKPATLISLGLLAATCLSIWPVVEYGEAGFDRVLSMADDPGQAFLKYHSQLAHRWIILYYISASVAALTMILTWKWPQILLPGSLLTVLLALGSLVAGIYIAQAGGEIRHREFRFGPTPQVQEDQGH
jgi:hypothetical protein